MQKNWDQLVSTSTDLDKIKSGMDAMGMIDERDENENDGRERPSPPSSSRSSQTSSQLASSKTSETSQTTTNRSDWTPTSQSNSCVLRHQRRREESSDEKESDNDEEDSGTPSDTGTIRPNLKATVEKVLFLLNHYSTLFMDHSKITS